jgi:hypothetical protein
MFCVTTAAVQGLAPHPLNTDDPEEKAANRKYLTGWLNRILESQITKINSKIITSDIPQKNLVSQ